MTLFSDRAVGSEAQIALAYEQAYYHLTSMVGPAVMDELAEAKTLKAAVDYVVAQRVAKDLKIGQPLDLTPLGLTTEQLLNAHEFRQLRAERLESITPAAQPGGFVAAVGGPKAPTERSADNSSGRDGRAG